MDGSGVGNPKEVPNFDTERTSETIQWTAISLTHVEYPKGNVDERIFLKSKGQIFNIKNTWKPMQPVVAVELNGLGFLGVRFEAAASARNAYYQCQVPPHCQKFVVQRQTYPHGQHSPSMLL